MFLIQRANKLPLKFMCLIQTEKKLEYMDQKDG